MLDIVIIGAGPIGLAAAVHAKRQNLSAIVLDKGIIVNSLYHFPTHMTFFTTADLLEIGNHPFPSTSSKPTRQMALDYYRLVAKNESLDIRQFYRVDSIDGIEGDFRVHGYSKHRADVDYSHPFELHTCYVIIATGYFDNPNTLQVPGTRLQHVSYYYSDPHQFFQQNVVVIGAGNSGAEAALEIYRHGANVTLVHRHANLKSTLKYWIAPDLRNRISEGSIAAYMPATVTAITEDAVKLYWKDQIVSVPVDYVLILIGFKPDVKFLQTIGLKIDDDSRITLTKQFESERYGVFVIGSAGFGRFTNKVFIENGRVHATTAVDEISQRLTNIDYVPTRDPLDTDLPISSDSIAHKA